VKTWGAPLRGHYALGTTTLATCWKATLTNGVVVAATSLDRDIVFDGVTYQSIAAYTPSDVESSSNLAPDNLELEGFLASPHVTDDDIHSGIWDFAAFEIFEVNYKDLTMGRNLLRKGTLGEVRAGRASFRQELRGLTQHYSRTIVRLIQRDCDADLGDALCKVNLVPFTVTGTIDSVSENRVLTIAARTEALNWFTAGKFTFTSGANSALGAAGADLSMEVKFSAPGTIELHQAMPFEIVAGDTYSVYAGCTKRFTEDCKDKFNNVVNNRGFHLLPGKRAYAGPQRTE
jgi:uncharacterized phage protein (TIGR02218 family)